MRREGVTIVAGKLQSAGLITYKRGNITVIDRPGLEERVCECYEAVRCEYDRLLPHERIEEEPSGTVKLRTMRLV